MKIAQLKTFMKRLKNKNIGTHAASTAFFFFLSLVPMLIMICTIIPYTPLTQQHLIDAASELLPQQLRPLVVSLIANVYEKSAGVLSVAIVVTLWSAGKGLMALMQGLNAVNGIEEKRNYFHVRIIASFYTLVMLLGVILSLFFMVFGEQIVNLALYRIPALQAAVSIAMNFRFIVAWILLSVFFAGIFAYVPDEKRKFRDQIPGAVFAAVGWSIFSWFFSAYLNYGNAYGIYGSLSIIVIVLLWMYFCMYLLLIGACLNKYYWNHME